MRKKAKIEEKIGVCGECANGEFYYTHRNLDVEGNPICLKCKYSKRSRIRDEKACEKYIKRQ